MANRYEVPPGASFTFTMYVRALEEQLGRAVGVVCLVTISLLLALIAFANRRYEIAPQPAAVVRMMAAPEQWLKWRFLGNLDEAIDANDKKLHWKAIFLTAALTMLFSPVVFLGGYAVYAFL